MYGVLMRPNITFDQLSAQFNTSVFIQGIITSLLAFSCVSYFASTEIISNFMQLILVATFIFLIGFVFKLAGKAWFKLVALLGFANLPLILVPCLKLIAFDLPVIAFILQLVVWIWTYNLFIKATAASCQISVSRVILLTLMPLLFLMLIVALSFSKLLSFMDGSLVIF